MEFYDFPITTFLNDQNCPFFSFWLNYSMSFKEGHCLNKCGTWLKTLGEKLNLTCG